MPTPPHGLDRRDFLWSLAAAAAVPLGTSLQSTDTTAAAARFNQWLTAVGLAKTFHLEKLRWATPPDKTADERWLQLELRFLTTSTKPEDETRRFLEAARAYRGGLDRTLPETLFYKLVNDAGVKRAAAAVFIIVLDETFLIAWDPVDGKIELQQGPTRDHRAVVDLGAAGASTDPTRGAVTVGRDAADLPARVQAFLKTYFGTAPSVQVTLRPLEPDFAGADIEGLRARVLSGTRFWERLQVSVELRTGATSRRAVCYIDGQYASGLGNSLPALDAYADMQPRYARELARFTDQMLRELQTYLARPA